MNTKREIKLSTTETIPGREIVKHVGPVCASLYVKNKFCQVLSTTAINKTRKEAMALLQEETEKQGGNAVIGMRLESVPVSHLLLEVLAYGTAVIV